jgi:hypothetical protein
MNEKIAKIENELSENERQKKELQEKLIQAYYYYLQSIGIEKGSKVVVKDYSSTYNIGIFSSLQVSYGEPKAIIMKIKKDGTPHLTATVWCYAIKDMSKFVE